MAITGGTLQKEREKQNAILSSPRCQQLSVIIPAYNAESFLAEQLEALKAQEYEGAWEIIVVNNRSTDNTVKIAETYQQSMPHLRLVHALEKQKRAYAYNTGAKAAKGNAFIFCDADDIVAPGWLKAMARALEQHDLVAGGLDLEALNQNAPWRPAPQAGSKHCIAGFMPYVITCNMGVSRQAFEASGGFAEEFTGGGDVDLSWRLQLLGYTIYDAPDAIVHYRYRDTLKGMWKQSLRVGYFQTLHYRRFKSYGMPRTSIQKALATYRRLFKVKKIVRLILKRVKKPELEKWVWQTGIYSGRLLGSIRFRVLYL